MKEVLMNRTQYIQDFSVERTKTRMPPTGTCDAN